MMHTTLKALLTISFTLGILVSCTEKVVTETSYNNTFSVPIQKSGLPPELAIDSVVIQVTESTSKGDVILYQHKIEGWFVTNPDYEFSVQSSESTTLILQYWVYSNGRIILSQDQTILPSNKGGALPDPEIISQDTLDVIVEEQNTAETSLTLKTNPDHESCVKQFSPKVIQAVGTDEITFTFTSNSTSNCTFLYWELDANGTAQLKDTATSFANTILVNGAQGFLIAHFLLPNETMSSSTPRISSSLEVSEQGTSSSNTSVQGTSSSNTIAVSSTTSNSSSSGNPIKKFKIDGIEYLISDNDTITYKQDMHSGKYVSGWSALNGVTTSWKNGVDAGWTIAITYKNLPADTGIKPTFVALHNALTGPIGTFPARLYPQGTAYMLLMANSGEWNGISQTPLNADFSLGTTLNHSFVTTQTPLLPKRLDRGFSFSTSVVSGSMNIAWTTSASHISTLFSLNTTSSAVLSGSVLQSNVEDSLGATNISPNDTALILTGITSKDGKSLTLYPKNASTSLSPVTALETQATHNLTDISIARGSKTTVKYLATEEYKNSTGSYMHRILFGSFGLAPTAKSFQSPGTLWAVIPTSTAGFFAFGNKDGKYPHIFCLSDSGVTQDQYTFLDTNAMEYTGGRMLSGGQIIVWGSAVGSRKGTPSHTKQKGVVALYNNTLDLVWSQPVNMVPFDVYPNANAGFLVAGFESVDLGTPKPSKILFMGPHGEQ